MNSGVIVFIALLAVVNAGIIAVPSTRILQGPSSRTTIVGPDGSSISAFAPGGQVVLDDTPALVAPAAPVVVAAPAVVAAAPVAAHAAPVVVHNDLDGQYVHDFTETLYDDGSYKPELYP